MITLSKSDVEALVSRVILPTTIECKFNMINVTYTAKQLGIPSLYVIGAYKKRKSTWLNKLLKYHCYDLVGIKTPTKSIVNTTVVGLSEVLSIVKENKEEPKLDRSKWRGFDFMTVAEIEDIFTHEESISEMRF